MVLFCLSGRLSYTSPNAPTKAEVLGTWLLKCQTPHRASLPGSRLDGGRPGLGRQGWPAQTERLGRITSYEYAVLVTNLDVEVPSLGQLYRDRADAENAFDELKNQWSWGGFTTHDLHRCQFSAGQWH